MLGWHISVYRKTADRLTPAEFESPKGTLLAQWQGNDGALGWILKVCESDTGQDLGGNGYPYCFTARCGSLRPVILGDPPGARKVWIHGPDDVIDYSKWKGQTFIDHSELQSVDESEWLLIEAWDES